MVTVSLLSVGVLLGAAKVAVSSVQDKVQASANTLVGLAGLGLVVLLGARAIVEL